MISTRERCVPKIFRHRSNTVSNDGSKEKLVRVSHCRLTHTMHRLTITWWTFYVHREVFNTYCGNSNIFA